MRKLSVVKSFGLVIVFLGLTACGGGGSDDDDAISTTPTTSSRSVSGGGVKGPLANAIVKVYMLDSSKADFKGAEVATATTNASAAIVGLALPFPVTPPYILEFTSDAGTTDITTGAAPVITTMRTVITQSLLDSGEQIYATPLTTMAVDIAIANSNPATTTDQFKTALTAAAAQVVSTLGFGMDSSIDIFDTPPLVDDTTGSAAEQADVAAYRTAVEAVTAIAFQINQQSSDGNTDSVLAELSADLADGGGIDGSAGTQINTNTLQVLQQDPASLPIPNSPTGQTVGDVQAILVAETATTGSSTATTQLAPGGSITTTPKSAETNPDSDGDGTLNVDDALPNDPNEDTDSDGDGIGDNADADDNNNGILDVDEGQTPTPVANDTDQDGVEDSTDNCPAIFNPSQTNTDAQADGGDACDSDDDDDAEPDATDAFPLDSSEQTDTDSDGLGDNVADSDDDNDGIADVSDTDVAPAGAPSVGVACSLLRDCDGDGVFDGADFDPVDPSVTSNFAPVANADSVTVTEDAATFSIAVTANDTDNDGNPNDTVNLDSIGSNDTLLGVAVINGNNIDYTPVADASGTDTFTYTVTDGTVTATASVSVTVNAANDAPVIAETGPLPVIMDEDGLPTAFAAPTINATDAENDALTWTLGTGAVNGTAMVSGSGASPAITYSPNGNFGGSDSFTATVSDGVESASITVNVTVRPVNDAPEIAETGPLPVIMSEDGSPTVFTAPTISATDTDGDPLSWDLASTAANGTATVSGTGASPTVTYTPNQDFVGSDNFDVRVSDATGSTTITINVTVDPVNDAPVIAESGPLPVIMSEDGSPTVFMAPTISATDTDGDTLTWTGSAATQGAATVSGAGASPTVTYTPNQDFNGSDNFDVSVSDGMVSATITVTITVDPVNDDPVAVDDSESVSQNGLVIIDVLANDSDVENDTLTIAVDDFTDAANGTVTQNGDDTFDYVPNPEYIGADSFTYTVSDGNGGSATGTVNITVNPPGVAAIVADLLDVTQGGGVGAVESWNGTLPEFEYWRDSYDATAGTLSFIEEEYDYDTETFVDISGFDSYWLTSTGTWELPSSIDVVTPNDGDGSMVIAVRNATDTENVVNLRIRASTQDIDGDLISDYLDANLAAQMLNPAATFGTGAQLVTSYSFESLTDAYSFELEDWCETENPARWTALNNSCNGVFINTTSSYASSLAELQVSIAWTDTETNDDSGLDVVSMSYDESTNSELLAELVVAGNVVNYYVRDYDLTGTDYIIKLAETSSWSLDSVSGVMMIRFTIPAALESQFPDLGDEGGLNPFFTEFGGFVRGGVLEAIGSISADDNILNGIALDEVLANFDAPAAPDVTELIGTWVSNATSFNGDPTVFHYFSSFNYEVSGTCDSDGTIGLEYGTMTVNAVDGTFTTSTSVNGRGNCSLADAAGPGTTLSVNGDTLTLDISGQVSTFSRLKGDLNPLLGSWLNGDITVGGDGGHVLLTFFDDSSYMHSEDCSNDGVVGTEYGSYTWDEGGSNQVTTSQVYDANGGNPGCGLSENTGDWEFAVTGDTLTVTVPGDGSVDFTRHSPALVPIVPAIAFDNSVLTGTSRYDVYFDDDDADPGWVIEELAFGANGSDFTLTDLDNSGNPSGVPENGSYEVINGVLQIPGDLIMIMSLDVATGAQRVCWQDTYVELNDCNNPGDEFLFDNSVDALAFLNARINGVAFSGSAVNASTVVASGLFMLELDDYYDAEADDWVDTTLFFELTADGINATENEYLLIDGSWVEATDYFDIALTSTGWKSNVDWRLDASLIADPAVTLSNVEAGDTLNSLTAIFSEMAIDGQPILDFVDPELAPGLVNGMFTTGARVYETSITVNNDYYYLNNWGSDCDDGSGGNYNGNCNVAQLRTLNPSTGELTGFTVATDASFVGDNTATIELGWNGSMSLVAVFVTGGVLEFWEVNWSVSSDATLSDSTGTWTSEVVGTETLVTYVVPIALQNSYQVQGDDDTPAVFLSQQNGYMRFGELEDEAGQMETVYFFNDVAFEDINNNIPGVPTLP